MTHIIKNYDELSTTKQRADALKIIEAAYSAIDTERVIRETFILKDGVLSVDGRSYDLASYKRVRLLGFGKVSCKALQTVESILHQHVSDGIAIDVRGGLCGVVEIKQGTHPHPSVGNVAITERIVDLAKDSTQEDLVIVVVSGGGSSLLCWPAQECDQGIKLFEDSSRVGMTIEETNIVRRHISGVKGGGLATILHPAQVIGLIFCDIPGSHYEDVASGPTYFDESTVTDATAILEKHGLDGYVLNETPKDRSLFDKVHNVRMISNIAALEAMQDQAQQLGYSVANIGDARYDTPAELAQAMSNALETATAVIAGGEVRLEVTSGSGKGGRCQYFGLESLLLRGEHDLYTSFASDGIDNSDSSGVIADVETAAKIAKRHLSIETALKDFNTYDLFLSTGDMMFTGVTDANVSDLYLALRTL